MRLTPIALLAALTFGGAAVAQTSSPETTPPQSSSPTSSMPTTNTPTQEAPPQGATGKSQEKTPLALQSSGSESWNMVKGHDKGYVTKSDALPNSWLAVNFSNCDKDGNGKVTQDEYEACRKHY